MSSSPLVDMFDGDQINLPQEMINLPHQQVAEAGEVTEADLVLTTPSTVLEPEICWISPTARHPPLLVKILNYVYRQHRFQSKFRWSTFQLNNGKHVWFIRRNRCSPNHRDTLLLITVRRGVVHCMFLSIITNVSC